MVEKGKGSPMTSEGRREVAGFYARNFSVSQLRDGGTLLLSVVALTSPPQLRASTHLGTTTTHVEGCVDPDAAARD